jgi:hypothetical protein
MKQTDLPYTINLNELIVAHKNTCNLTIPWKKETAEDLSVQSYACYQANVYCFWLTCFFEGNFCFVYFVNRA